VLDRQTGVARDPRQVAGDEPAVQHAHHSRRVARDEAEQSIRCASVSTTWRRRPTGPRRMPPGRRRSRPPRW
jgi:hypothetical protein